AQFLEVLEEAHRGHAVGFLLAAGGRGQLRHATPANGSGRRFRQQASLPLPRQKTKGSERRGEPDPLRFPTRPDLLLLASPRLPAQKLPRLGLAYGWPCSRVAGWEEESFSSALPPRDVRSPARSAP